MTKNEDQYKEYMAGNQRYICPKCNHGGASPTFLDPPTCYECHERGHKVVMIPFTYDRKTNQ